MLISQSSIDAYLSQKPLDPIVALGYFLTTSSLSLNTLEYKLDHTVQQLYQTSYKLVMTEIKHNNGSVEPLQSLLEQSKRRIETVVGEDSRMNQEFSKKLKSCVNDSFDLISEQNKLLTTASGQNNTSNNKYDEEDILLIQFNSIVGKKKKDWKSLFDKGKAEGFFKSCSPSTGLKTSYWHIKRRRKL
jgi:hypothetical protein